MKKYKAIITDFDHTFVGIQLKISNELKRKITTLTQNGLIFSIATGGSFVVIGDNFNDYPLLTVCGFKIAMEDAPKELKDIADFIAPTEKDDGFLKVLNRFF